MHLQSTLQLTKAVSIHRGINELKHKTKIDREPGVFFQSDEVKRYYGDLGHAYFFESLADKGYVIGCSARSARLSHNNRRLIRIIFARKYFLYNASDCDNSRVTSIVIDVFQTDFNSRLCFGNEYDVIPTSANACFLVRHM